MRDAFCLECGGGLFDFDEMELTDFETELDNDEDCPHCGAELWQNCNFCNGTGKIPDLSVGIGLDHCSECGRALKKQKSTKCILCNGKGKTSTFHTCNPFF